MLYSVVIAIVHGAVHATNRPIRKPWAMGPLSKAYATIYTTLSPAHPFGNKLKIHFASLSQSPATCRRCCDMPSRILLPDRRKLWCMCRAGRFLTIFDGWCTLQSVVETIMLCAYTDDLYWLAGYCMGENTSFLVDKYPVPHSVCKERSRHDEMDCCASFLVKLRPTKSEYYVNWTRVIGWLVVFFF